MAPGADEPAERQLQSARALRLMDLLGLSEDELCTVLAVDPLTLLSGQIEHRAELGILLALLAEPAEQIGPAVLQRWVRAHGPAGRPIDALLRRDFAGFEDAVQALTERGFVLRAGGGARWPASGGPTREPTGGGSTPPPSEASPSG